MYQGETLAGMVRSRETGEGSKFEVFGTSNLELRTSDRAFLACLARHAHPVRRRLIF